MIPQRNPQLVKLPRTPAGKICVICEIQPAWGQMTLLPPEHGSLMRAIYCVHSGRTP